MSMQLSESVDTDVNTKEKLASVPEKYLSNDPTQPLLQRNADGSEQKYALNPLFYCVLFILIIELLERFSYYGLSNSQFEYLVGGYDKDWNANMTSIDASSFVSSSAALAYAAPLVGGILADGLFGDYFGIMIGASCLYLPGLIIIALCSYPFLLGDTFNMGALKAGMLVLWPLGTGLIKSVVNVFGAKQYHPKLQSDLIESYYISFYVVINIGALLGGIIIPLIAQYEVAIAYTIPSIALGVGILIFIAGTKRYARAKPDRKALWTSLRIITSPLCCKTVASNKESNGGKFEDSRVEGLKNLLLVFPASFLVVPFNMVYNQMITCFMVQGNAMRSVGFVDPSMMTNVDSISVLFWGAVYQSLICPSLKKRGIRLKTTHKFAIGTAIGALAVLAAIIVDYAIHRSGYNEISILWQFWQFFFIGAGEILTISIAYDVTFTIAPKEQKALASGLNLFVIGTLSNFICIGMYNACESWFPTDATDPSEYAGAKVYNYLWILFSISCGGSLFNLLPPVSSWLEQVMDQAIELNLRQKSGGAESTTRLLSDSYVL